MRLSIKLLLLGVLLIDIAFLSKGKITAAFVFTGACSLASALGCMIGEVDLDEYIKKK